MAEKNLIPITSCEQIPNKVYEELLNQAEKSVRNRNGTYPADAAQDAVLEFIKYIEFGKVSLDEAKNEYLVHRESYDEEDRSCAPVNYWIKRVANNNAIEYIRKKVDKPGIHISIEYENSSGNSGQYLMDNAVSNDVDEVNGLASDLDDWVAALDLDPKFHDVIITGFHDCLDCACEAYKQRKPSKSVHVVNTEDETRKQLLVAEYLYIFTKRKFSDEKALSHVVLCQELGLIMADGVAGNFKAQFMGSVSDCLKSKLAIYTTEAESLA